MSKVIFPFLRSLRSGTNNKFATGIQMSIFICETIVIEYTLVIRTSFFNIWSNFHFLYWLKSAIQNKKAHKCWFLSAEQSWKLSRRSSGLPSNVGDKNILYRLKPCIQNKTSTQVAIFHQWDNHERFHGVHHETSFRPHVFTAVQFVLLFFLLYYFTVSVINQD